MPAEPRGIRNNNPLNIKRSQAEWRGRMPAERMNAVQRAETVFEVFETPEYGIRAGAIILRNYLRRNLDTPAEIIASWAPPSDGNHTAVYARKVAEALGVPVDAVVDTSDPAVLLPMFRAMIAVENGRQPYDDDTIMRGILMALNPRPARAPEPPRREQVAGQVRTAVAAVSGILMTLVATGAITQDQADAVGAAAGTLLSDENIRAAGTVATVIAGAAAYLWSAVRSWAAKATAASEREEFA